MLQHLGLDFLIFFGLWRSLISWSRPRSSIRLTWLIRCSNLLFQTRIDVFMHHTCTLNLKKPSPWIVLPDSDTESGKPHSTVYTSFVR
ncbi:hypothetical protein BX600DRAFT_26297 [Xylariales sp. PMI_506]|nr:hypothetical protein BX600DRAFT_26297 [Xylariales sp. PMI_506]